MSTRLVIVLLSCRLGILLWDQRGSKVDLSDLTGGIPQVGVRSVRLRRAGVCGRGQLRRIGIAGPKTDRCEDDRGDEDHVPGA